MVQKLYDTPGVHLHHRQAAVIHSEDLPALAPRSRLRGQSLTVCIFIYKKSNLFCVCKNMCIVSELLLFCSSIWGL